MIFLQGANRSELDRAVPSECFRHGQRYKHDVMMRRKSTHHFHEIDLGERGRDYDYVAHTHLSASLQ